MDNKTGAIIGGSIALAGAFAAVMVAMTSNRSAPPAAESPRQPTAAERKASELMATTDLPKAMAMMRPYMDDTVHEPLDGARTVALWAAHRMTWQQIAVPDQTSFGKIHKDVEAERGKTMCASGLIVEIEADRSVMPPRWVGNFLADSQNVISFIAVGSSGDLVARSEARFCGVVTGKHSYFNAGGGTTHAAFAVGMFDLPENRAPKPAQ